MNGPWYANAEKNSALPQISPVERIGKYEFRSASDDSILQNIEYRSVYRAFIGSESLPHMRFPDKEVAALCIFSVKDLRDLSAKFPERIASGLEESFPVYFKRSFRSQVGGQKVGITLQAE